MRKKKKVKGEWTWDDYIAQLEEEERLGIREEEWNPCIGIELGPMPRKSLH